MKGGLAAAMWATKVALEQGLRPRGDVVFHVVSDEEVVGNGTREIVERAPACDVTISLEPSELRLCAAEGGLVHFRIEVEGEEAHASTRYLSLYAGGKAGGGVNAIEKTLKLVVALQELERQWANAKSHPILPPGFDTLSPGIIVGGPGGGADGRLNLFSNAGTAPNYCSVEYNMWWYPDESYDDVRAEVEDVVDAVARTDPWLREHPPKLTWKLGNIYFPPLDVPLDHPAVGTLAGCLERSRPRSRRPRASVPRPISPGTASASCPGSSAGRDAWRSATSPTSTSRPSSSSSRRRCTRRCSSTGAGSRAR